MSNSNNQKQKQKWQEMLKKVQSQTPQQKNKQLKSILNRKSVFNPSKYFQKIAKIPFFMLLKAYYQKQRKRFLTTVNNKQKRHLTMITVFLFGGLIINWGVAKQADNLNQRIMKTESSKQKLINAQNEYINKMLSKSQFESVPIEDEDNPLKKYKYQEGEFLIETSADMLQAMEKEKKMEKQL